MHIEFPCQYCGTSFLFPQKQYEYDLKHGRSSAKYCSRNCVNTHRHHRGTKELNCSNCNASFVRQQKEIRKSKSGKNFCSKSCAARFNNKNKKTGMRRSKLEKFIESSIVKSFPNLTFILNDRSITGYELDFYFPSLSLAIEFNGIFHHKPIFGDKKFSAIKRNDNLKAKMCLEQGVKLFVYNDNSKRFTEPTALRCWKSIRSLLITEMLLSPFHHLW